MFADRYFPSRYDADRYFPSGPGGGGTATTTFRDRKVKWLWKPERKWPLMRFSMLALLLFL